VVVLGVDVSAAGGVDALEPMLEVVPLVPGVAPAAGVLVLPLDVVPAPAPVVPVVPAVPEVVPLALVPVLVPAPVEPVACDQAAPNAPASEAARMVMPNLRWMAFMDCSLNKVR
jgi:hypothetical protein